VVTLGQMQVEAWWSFHFSVPLLLGCRNYAMPNGELILMICISCGFLQAKEQYVQHLEQQIATLKAVSSQLDGATRKQRSRQPLYIGLQVRRMQAQHATASTCTCGCARICSISCVKHQTLPRTTQGSTAHAPAGRQDGGVGMHQQSVRPVDVGTWHDALIYFYVVRETYMP
jgi:hypothetical protein